MIARNERGRQARERARSALAVKKQRRLEDKRSALGVALSSEEAVTRIQSCMRGAIWRKRVAKEADHELMFVHMKPKVRGHMTLAVMMCMRLLSSCALQQHVQVCK